MSLTAAGGPIGPRPTGWFSEPIPAGLVFVEPHPRRVQALIDGVVVLDTEQVLLVHRPGSPLSYAFTASAVGTLAHEPEPHAPGYVRVPWNSVDVWLEEGRRLVDYPPNPYHRVDCRPTARRLRVAARGTVLVDTTDTIALFETSIDPRLYVPKSHVRMDLLRPSQTVTYCNYKGYASYWSFVTDDLVTDDGVIDNGVIDDVAWSYEEPLPESQPIAGCLSFDATKVVLHAELPTGGIVTKVNA